MIRAAIALGSYLTGLWAFLVAVCVLPGQSLALVSPQAYARVVAQAEWIAYQAATKPSVVSTVATAAASTSPASVAIRAVAGPVGWALLGVTVGMALYQTFYSSEKVSALKEASRQPGQATVAGLPVTNLVQGTPGSCGTQGGQSLCDGSHDQSANFSPSPYPNLPPGWEPSPVFPNCHGDASGCNTWVLVHRVGGANPGVQAPGADATPQQAVSYLGGLPASDPLSIESNSKPLGQGVSPDNASQVTTVPVSPTDLPSTVKPSSQVGPTDIKIADNVPPPPGTQTTQPTTQQSTTTTTKTTNPDGSVTEDKATTAAVSCTTPAGHEQRTMGTVLQQHLDKWNGSGLLAAVNLLKTLTWPTTLPVVTLPSTFFGTQQVDFNQWAWFFTALRTLVIAVASLAAYRIIFVGR